MLMRTAIEDRMSSKILAFINFKGGAGNRSEYWSDAGRAACRKLLVADLDPQSNTSLWLMRPDRWRDHTIHSKRSTSQIFEDALCGKIRFSLDEALVKEVVTWTGFTDLPRLHLLPASIELLRVEHRIHSLPPNEIYQILDGALNPEFKDYDYVLPDCPPNLYRTTKNAIFAADSCVVPYVPDI